MFSYWARIYQVLIKFYLSFLLTIHSANATESPYDKFNAKSNFTNKTTVEWLNGNLHVEVSYD